MPPAVAERPVTSEHTGQEKKYGPNNVDLAKDTLARAIQDFDVVVLKGHTGCGKTVSGPPAFLEGMQRANPGRNVRMLVGEPRQFLAEGSAKIAAKRQNKPFGGEYVGFYHGDDSNYIDKKTQIVYTVNGSIRNSLQRDITLAEYDAVFLDEIHLREVDQYAIRIGLKQCQLERAAKHMPPLKIIIASADATQRDGDYHGNATLIEVPGTKPQEVKQFFGDSAVSLQNAPKEAARKAAQIVKDRTNYGDVLAFLPGRAEIIEAQTEFNRIMAEEGLADEYKSALLTGGGGDDNKALQAKLTLGNDDRGRAPIVVFGTDVAETGANFPWLTKVIDAGYSRIDVFNDEIGMSRLETRPVAFAGYKQRIGRLGRVDIDGEFYALYPEADLNDESKHPKQQPPAVVKSDLTQLVLSLRRMGLNDIYNLEYPDDPGAGKLDRAEKTLFMLGAVDDNKLTPEGEEMADLPMDAHYAKILVEAKKHGCVDAAGVLFGFLNNNRSVFDLQLGENFRMKYAQFRDDTSDFITMLNVWNSYVVESKRSGGDVAAWAQRAGLNLDILQGVEKAKTDLVGEEVLKNTDISDKKKEIDIAVQRGAIETCVIAGFADKLLRREDNMSFTFVDGEKKGVRVGNTSGIDSAPYLVSGEFRIGKRAGATPFTVLNQVIEKDQYDDLVGRLEHLKLQLQANATNRQNRRTEEGEAASAEALRIMQEHRNRPEGAEGSASPEAQAAVGAAETIVNRHEDRERQLEQVRADPVLRSDKAHQQREAHAAAAAQQHEQNAHEEASLWQEFKHALGRVGSAATYPVRTLWKWFKKLWK